MLFETRLRDGIAAGTITVALRRWKRPQVVAGGRYRTGLDIIEMDSVDVISEADLTNDDALAAGYPGREQLIASLRGDPAHPIHRLRFHRVDEPDPRATLAANDRLCDDDIADIRRRLARLDRASTHGPWTATV